MDHGSPRLRFFQGARGARGFDQRTFSQHGGGSCDLDCGVDVSECRRLPNLKESLSTFSLLKNFGETCRMKIFAFAIALFGAVAANAANRYAFVNAHYIDETTGWATISRTLGYQIGRAPQYFVTGVTLPVPATQTCQDNGRLFATVSEAVYRDPNSKEAPQIGTSFRTVEIMPTYQASECVDVGGQARYCTQSAVVVRAQNLLTSFDLPVYAILSRGDQGSVRSYWPGPAFVKTWTVPSCNGVKPPTPPVPPNPPAV